MPIELPRSCDVAIVGGGPAGLAAATELRRLGVGSVVVIDREPEIGGIPRHCGHFPFGMREFGRVLRGPDYAARLAARARAAGVTVLTGTTVTALASGPSLTLGTPDGLFELSAKRVLLATGVRESSRAARLIGGTKPGGILSTGALQGLVYLKHIKPFERPVILGSELVAFSAIMTCGHLGISPIAMVEPNPRITIQHPAEAFPLLNGVRLLLDTEIAEIRGAARVEEVLLRHRSGRTETVKTDGVIVTGQFLPEASLLPASHLDFDPGSGGPVVDQFGRCSDPHFFAAGNLLRAVETAGWSWAEGRAVAGTIATSLAGSLPPAPGRVVAVGDGALKYVVPHRLVPGSDAGATAIFQLRVKRPAKGRLTLSVEGREVWSRRIHALPERRITVPLSVLPEGGETARFSIVES